MQIDAFFKQNHLALTGKTLVVAVSGGPDSMALLDLLNTIQERYQLQLIAAHLDHQLRKDSLQEARIIAEYCQDKPIKQVNGYWPKSAHPKVGIEAAARQYRYDFLLKVMRQEHGDYLLTAHHNDDLLENIILKFIRSGNPNEMNSLKAVTKREETTLLRPLLTVKKGQLLDYVQDKKITFVKDITNDEDDVLRNRIRHHIIPLLKQENAQVGTNAVRFSRQMEVLSKITERNFEHLPKPQEFLGCSYRLPSKVLSTLSVSEQTSYWQNFIWQTFQRRVNENLANFKLINYQDYFYLVKDNLPQPVEINAISLNHAFNFLDRQFLVTKEPRAFTLLDCFLAPDQVTFYAGSLAAGTKLRLRNGQHVKSKKKFAQKGIPNVLRPYCLTIYADGEPVFIEQTYHNQECNQNMINYYVYQKNGKKI
ncbi:tRNA lysidine(34) synthetase TilS [Lactobacillus sp. ESL0684]|uniref:tRNA lysidine(34) synthetase TilS n=1 Tax=Lactobacillus sp. ESL0684 TaxID=2983213 RepID=UPI0023F698B0|nr:tRNA lysidine(34) synthetase TilS [Lactobacillus sp. ESL0684]WEV44047.1 tRNA lysidine(34) synthetase TilS [Lactobacillus sp. ESL0684]